jgi:hypothetical protein
MARCLSVSLNILLKNPSPLQLIHTSNLLILSPSLTPVAVRYSVLEGDTLIHTNRVYGPIPNSLITSKLSTIDYNKHDINIHDFLKHLPK